tara:strand:+ start:15002 stop:15721 length:720 start_codon:yes stop_codon:yes gene_type:complete
MKDVAFILYTHSDCSDIWKPFFTQLEKWFPEAQNRYIFVNENNDQIDESFTVVEYDDALSYTKRVSSCLSFVKEDYMIYLHEDMILYDRVNPKNMEKLIDVARSKDIDFVKLLRGPESITNGFEDYTGLYTIPHSSEYLFSIQPHICKTESMMILFDGFNIDIWNFELQCQNKLRTNNFLCVGVYHGEHKRGRHHYNSSTFPYIATAIVKGKWNYSEYKKELDTIFNTYNIDKTKRGIK